MTAKRRAARAPHTFQAYADGDQPRWVYGLYGRTKTRHPRRAPSGFAPTPAEVTGPAFFGPPLAAGENDLTRRGPGKPRAIGDVILVTGRVLADDGRPLEGVLIEAWQANAAGRYRHRKDDHDAPLDANFDGHGRAVTDGDGGYAFLTIKPGPYPMPGPVWRTPHLHFSLFGGGFFNRLITQTYFPGEPLNGKDPIFNGIRAERARRRLMMTPEGEPGAAHPECSMRYSFDFVLRGAVETPFEGR